MWDASHATLRRALSGAKDAGRQIVSPIDGGLRAFDERRSWVLAKTGAKTPAIGVLRRALRGGCDP
ncbi:hypothetical protein VTN02DRAFT_2317 [Thermoascus thermophilus]